MSRVSNLPEVGAATPLDGVLGTLPKWIRLIPAGKFSGIDGRGPYKVDPAAVIAASTLPFVVDFLHQSDKELQHMTVAPAAGWVEELQARKDGVWGRVEWTPGGRAALEAKEYRFISPVFRHRTDDLVVSQLLRAALTNTPNLSGLAVLNSVRPPPGPGAPTLAELLRQQRDAIPDAATIFEAMGLKYPPKEGT